MPAKRLWKQTQDISPDQVQQISANKSSRNERMRRREEQRRERDNAELTLRRFIAARPLRWRFLNANAINKLNFLIGDEIVFNQDDIIWTVRDIDYKYGACLLHTNYGDERLVVKQSDEPVSKNGCVVDYYNRVQRSKRIMGLELASAHSEKRMELFRTKPVAPRKETTLMGACMQTIARQQRLIPSLDTDVLPENLKEEIRTRIDEVVPIPIHFRVRHALAHRADTGLCSIQTDADAHWKAQTWILHPPALSYCSIWRACARELRRRIRPAALPDKTVAVLDLEPDGGAAGFLRAYAAACRDGEPRFDLRYDHVWRTVDECFPACRRCRKVAHRAARTGDALQCCSCRTCCRCSRDRFPWAPPRPTGSFASRAARKPHV
jgi:hypothetical protein